LLETRRRRTSGHLIHSKAPRAIPSSSRSAHARRIKPRGTVDAHGVEDDRDRVVLGLESDLSKIPQQVLETDLRRDNIPPGRISVLLLKTPRPDEEKHLERMALRRLSEDHVPHLGSASLQTITWSIVSGVKGLENDVVILAALTDIETDWHRGVAYVGMSRARNCSCERSTTPRTPAASA
jgi:hypothetical protein